jgi:hypothetical protein
MRMRWRRRSEDHLTAAHVAAYRTEGERAATRITRREPPFDNDWTAWRPDPAWGVPVLPPGWDAFKVAGFD